MPAYAGQVRSVIASQPLLTPVDPPWRAPTKFEQRGVDAGRPPIDLAARRRPR
jgi:hypothetical protein